MANLASMANANADRKPTIKAILHSSDKGHNITIPGSLSDSDIRDKQHVDAETGKTRTTFTAVASVYNAAGDKLAEPMRIKVTGTDKDGKPVEKIGLFSVATVNLQFRGFEK